MEQTRKVGVKKNIFNFHIRLFLKMFCVILHVQNRGVVASSTLSKTL